jgi:DNA-directed RNA polymerase specialized sigma subunit
MSAKDKDAEMWQQWNRTKSPMDLEALVKQLNPLIQGEVNRRAGTLARPTLEAQAKILTVKAIKSFNPNRNVKLSTHVTNQLQKLSRVNYAHQNAARVPEHSMLQFHSYNLAKEEFTSDHGREPTTDELADCLKWSPRKLESFQTQFGRAELLESIDTPSDLFVAATHDPRIHYAYHSLSPRQQKIFEHLTGYNGAKRLSNRQILKQLGITQGVLSYEKSKIRSILEEAM